MNELMLGGIIVVGVSQFIKDLDKKSKFKKIYFLFPLFLSCLTGFAMNIPFVIGTFVLDSLSILGFSIIGYETIFKFVKNFTSN